MSLESSVTFVEVFARNFSVKLFSEIFSLKASFQLKKFESWNSLSRLAESLEKSFASNFFFTLKFCYRLL